jgi:hypothetical protein
LTGSHLFYMGSLLPCQWNGFHIKFLHLIRKA